MLRTEARREREHDDDEDDDGGAHESGHEQSACSTNRLKARERLMSSSTTRTGARADLRTVVRNGQKLDVGVRVRGGRPARLVSIVAYNYKR
jgi:hypothetical protein